MRRAVGLLLALIAVVLAACGGGHSGDARSLVKETFSNPKQIRSGNVSLAIRLRTMGLAASGDKPVDIRFTGPFERTSKRAIPRFAFSLTASLAGRSFTAGATSTGKAGFLSLQGRDYGLPAAAYANFRRSFSSVTKAATAPGRAPELPWFRDPKVAGDEDVGGVRTEHVTGTVDLAKLLDSIARNRRPGTPGFGATQRKQVLEAVQDPSFGFWTGKDDHLLRRVKVGFRFVLPAAARAQAGGLRAADVAVDYQLSALNEAQTIPTPSNPRPVSELQAQLQSYSRTLQAILGGLTTSGGLGTSGGTATPPADSLSSRTRKYDRCIQAARGDVARQQRCATLLGR